MLAAMRCTFPEPRFRSSGMMPNIGRSRDVHFIHLGVYIYTRDILMRLSSLPTGTLEHVEKLEQLRALEHGIRIRVWENEASVTEDRPTGRCVRCDGSASACRMACVLTS